MAISNKIFVCLCKNLTKTVKHSKRTFVTFRTELWKFHNTRFIIDTRHPFLCKNLSVQVQRPYVDPKYSYAFGKSTEHLIYTTIDQQLENKVNEFPDELGFISHSEGITRTFKQLNDDVNSLSKALVKKFGIEKGDSVGVFAYNSYNWLVVQFACTRIGATLTPINPSYKPSELAYILSTGQIKCIFLPGPRSHQAELNNHIEILQSEEIINLSKANKLNLLNAVFIDAENYYDIGNKRSDSDSSNHKVVVKIRNCNFHNWNDIQTDGIIYKSNQEAEEAGIDDLTKACVIDPDSISPDDLFAIYYTSGTTGKPKGACVSQFAVVNNTRFCQNRIRNGRSRNWRAVVVTTLPLFHIFAGVLNALSPLTHNTCIVLSSYKYDIKTFVDAIIKHQSNLITLTPTMLIDMLSYIERNELKDLPLKVINSGGAALPPEVVTRAYKTLPNLEELRTGYGSTENAAVSTMQTMYEPREFQSITVGPPIDFTEVRIVDPRTNKLVPHYKQGEIQTRGHNIMVDYLNQPDKTAEVLNVNRWYRTGDVGLMHSHGSIQICGRIKHMIIKGGENIYPEEVRELIHKLKYVEDVHVVGVPDKRYGEQVCAWIKLRPGYEEAKTVEDRSEKKIHTEDIVAFCKDKITYFKIPQYILFVDEFPMTATKKIQNHIITEQSVKIFGLDEK